MIAHADPGPAGVGSLLLLTAAVLGGGLWLVRLNRRLDESEDPLPRRRRSRSELFLIAALVVSIVAAAYVVLRPDPVAPAQVVVADLCRAAEQAETDTDAALDTFNGSPHGALHRLENDLRREDAALALDLAEAKQEAESALVDGRDDAPVRTARLAATTAEGYEALGTPVTGC